MAQTIYRPVGGIKANMHFILSVSCTTLREDISALARRYLCSWPFMTRLIPPTGVMGKIEGKKLPREKVAYSLVENQDNMRYFQKKIRMFVWIIIK